MEVKLNRCALERSAQRVFDRDIDFRAIESTVSRVELPFAGVVFVESFCQLLETSLLGVFANIEYRLANLFGKIPSLDLAKELLFENTFRLRLFVDHKINSRPSAYDGF